MCWKFKAEQNREDANLQEFTHRHISEKDVRDCDKCCLGKTKSTVIKMNRGEGELF